jgi:hypothetical protein
VHKLSRRGGEDGKNVTAQQNIRTARAQLIFGTVVDVDGRCFGRRRRRRRRRRR